jgi:addiction module HigA family antidote
MPKAVSTHPGEILLKDFLQPMQLTINAFSLKLRVPNNRILAICAGKRAVTPDTALRFARFFGNSAEFWLNLQMMHDLQMAKLTSWKQIQADVEPRANG